jgi:hypothetical protein
MAERKSGHATGMAGEFFVMERLFRTGHDQHLRSATQKASTSLFVPNQAA